MRFFKDETVLGDSDPVTIKSGQSVPVSFTLDAREVRGSFDLTAIVNPDRTLTAR